MGVVLFIDELHQFLFQKGGYNMGKDALNVPLP